MRAPVEDRVYSMRLNGEPERPAIETDSRSAASHNKAGAESAGVAESGSNKRRS